MGHCFEQEDVSVLYSLKKLQRVRLTIASNIDNLVKNLPQLKYVITTPKKSTGFTFGGAARNENQCVLREVGSTIIVGENFLERQNIEMARKLKVLVK